jgi:hypothetical protein
MADIRVIIDGKLADLPPQGLNLPLTYSLRSRDGLNINTGSRSEYSFELPSTKQNDDIFNRFWDVGGITINEQVFLDASIEVDGQPFFIGKCQLQSVTLRPDLYSWQGKTYKVAFYGNNSDWAIRLKTTYLYQLDFGSHLYERDAIVLAWDYTYATDFYKYVLIKWRDWDVFGQADALESTPALFVRHILEKIFASIGYTIASNFITTDWFSKLILSIPLSNTINDPEFGIEYLNISANYLWNPPINVIEYPFVFPFQTVAPTIGPNPYDPLTGIYTAPYTGFYLISLKAIFTNVAGSVDPSFFYGLNGEWTTFPPTWTYIEQPVINVDSILNYSFVLNLTQGDTLAMGLSFGLGSAPFELDFYYDIIGEAEIADNINLDFKYLINKRWSALDFIKGLAHAFNLVFETDEGARSVRIDPADRYLLEDRAFPLPNVREFKTGFYYRNDNLTNKVDLLKGGELVSETKMDSSITLIWKEDNNDATIEAMNQGQNVGLLQARYNFQPNRFSTNPNVLENPFFAPTITIVDSEIKATGSDKDVIIPIIWSTNYLETSTSTQKNIDVLPRLMISEQLIAGYNGLANVKTSGGVAPNQPPATYMVDYNDTAGFQTSLSFSDDVVNGFNISGLMKRFYLPELVRWQNGKQLEIYMYWDIVMIQNLTFRHRVIINSDTYILQEVNAFNVSKSGSTKTYLIQDFKEVDAEDRIQNTQIQSKVNV